MKTLTVLLLAIACFSGPTAFAAEPPQQLLRGTHWVGSFHFHRWTGKLRLNVRSELSPAGDLQYDFAGNFDGFPTPVRQLLAKFDVGCPTAPRQLRLVPVAGEANVYEGTITTVLSCPATAEAAAQARSASVRVVRYEISADGQRNHVIVKDPSGLVRVEYDLVRVNDEAPQ